MVAVNDDTQLKEIELLLDQLLTKTALLLEDCPDTWDFTLTRFHREAYPWLCAVQKLQTLTGGTPA